MSDKRIIYRSVFNLKDFSDSAVVKRIGAEPVHCFGRKSDKSAIFNYIGIFFE